MVVIETHFLATFTTTNAKGATTVVISTVTTDIPVVVETKEGLSQADKIALGIGLGVGLPACIVSIVALIGRSQRRVNFVAFPNTGDTGW